MKILRTSYPTLHAIRVAGMAGVLLLTQGISVAYASDLKMSMRLEFKEPAHSKSVPNEQHLTKPSGPSPWLGGFSLGAIPATLNSVKHFFNGLRHHRSVLDEADRAEAAQSQSLSLYDKTTHSIGLIPYGVSFAVSKDIDLQYAGNSAAVGSGAPWQSLRMINKDDPERHWYFAVDKVQFERKDAISAGVGVLLPLK